MSVEVRNGMSRKDLIRAAKAAGCEVFHPNATGEVAFRDPSTGEVVRMNNRRTDATREGVAFVRRVLKRRAVK